MRPLRLLSVLLVACSSSLVEGMDGLDTSQAKVFDMVGTWTGSAAADVLQRHSGNLGGSDLRTVCQLAIHLYYGGQKFYVRASG